MDINSVSSNKVVLNIRTPQGGELPLNKGEVVQAQVQSVGEDGLVTIVVKGKPIEAATEVPVKPGQQLLLMVDDVRNGKTFLKVVTPEMMGKIENTNISASLLEMGIAAKDDTILLSRKLLQYNLPVNQNNLNELNKSIKILGGMNPRNLEIAAFALSRNISGKAALESLAQFLSPQTDTAKLMPVLERFMEVLGQSSAQSEEKRPVAQKAPAASNNSEPVKAGQSAALRNSTQQSAEAKGIQLTEAKANFSAASTQNTGEAKNNNSDTVSSPVKAADLPADQSSKPMVNKADEPVLRMIAGNSEEDGLQPNVIISSKGEETDSTAKLNTAAKSSSSSLADEAPPVASRVTTADPEGAQVTRRTGSEGNQPADQTQESSAARGPAAAGDDAPVQAGSKAGNNNSAQNIRIEQNTGENPPADKFVIPADKNTQPLGNTAASQTMSKDSAAAPALAAAPTPAVAPAPAQNAETGTEARNQEPLAGSMADKAAAASREQNTSVVMTAPAAQDPENAAAAPTSSAVNKVDPDSDLSQKSLSQKMGDLLETLRSLIEIDPDTPPDKIARQMQTAVSSEKDIVKAITLLKDIAVSKDIIDKLPQIRDFSSNLNSVEKEIAGQQLFNVSSKNSSDQVSSYYFSFPVPMDQGYSLCQLKINKDSRYRLRDVDKLSLAVSLNTAKLGTVLYHVSWQRSGQLELQGVVENEASCVYLNNNNVELVKNLEELGYRVKHNGVKVAKSREEISIKPALQEVTERLRPLGIDVTV